MGSLDFLTPNALGYPTGQGQGSGCGAPYAPPEPDGFFEKIFYPKQLSYPTPPCRPLPGIGVKKIEEARKYHEAAPATPTTREVHASKDAPASSPIAAAPPTTPTPSGAPSTAVAPEVPSVGAAAASQPTPVTVVVNFPPGVATPALSTACATVPSLAPAEPAPSVPVEPSPRATPGIAAIENRSCRDKLVTAYSTNPRLRARQPRAQDEYLEELVDEKFHIRMLTKDAAGVVFVTPDGCNTVDFFVGPIEVNPPHGEAEDRDEVVTVGDLSITGASPGALQPGDHVTVVVPWRHASWVEMAAEHLRVPIHARFYTVAK